MLEVKKQDAKNEAALKNAQDKFRGALIGLAVGDVLGASIEFKPPGTFDPVSEVLGGGPFRLNPGEWTDDTSMALCLAQSLVERRGFDPIDQLEKYLNWWRNGYLSSKGYCFDIGNTVSEALSNFATSRTADVGVTHEFSAGNGSLMRLAPIPMFYFKSPETAINYAAESSRTTHAHPESVDACRYYAGLIVGALQGVSKDELLSSRYSPVLDYFQNQPLCQPIDEIALGSFKDKQPPEIQGRGYVVKSMEAALWAFYNGRDFEEGCKLAVNLGHDSDTTGAIYGQLAGAYYGESEIPLRWREKLVQQELITGLAEQVMDEAFEFFKY